MRKRLAVVVLAAVVCGAATAAWSADSRTAAPPRAIRIGGIDAVPAIRPWRYTGPNPDGWWCRPGFCRDVTNGTVLVDKEARLSARLRVRGEYGFEEPRVDDNGHAGLLTQILTSKAPFAVAEWYALRDDQPMTCCPPKIVETSTYGLLTADYRPKKSFGVMQSLLRPR